MKETHIPSCTNRFFAWFICCETGKGFMCIFCFWIRHIHVDWRFSFICRGYEGKYISLIRIPEKSPKLKTCTLKKKIRFCFSPTKTGVPKREAKWSLWRYRLCHQQHNLSNAIPDTDYLSLRNHLLFHGTSPSWFHALSVLCVVPLCKCHCG